MNQFTKGQKTSYFVKFRVFYNITRQIPAF